MRSRWQRLPAWQRVMVLVSAWLAGYLVLGSVLVSLFGPLVEPWNWLALGGFVLASVSATWLPTWFPGRRHGQDEVSR